MVVCGWILIDIFPSFTIRKVADCPIVYEEAAFLIFCRGFLNFLFDSYGYFG
jgi:hypothetical protein